MNLTQRINDWCAQHLDSDGDWDVNQSDAYRQGFIDATKLAAKNATLKNIHKELVGSSRVADYEIDEQSILKQIKE